MFKIVWDEAKVAELTQLWADGFTARQIGEKMGGISRNAIIGKVTRLNLPRRVDVTKPRAKRETRIFIRRVNLNQVRLQPEVPPEGGVPFGELSNFHCREIVGWDPGPTGLARYCGCRKIENSSYCSAHHAKNYQPLRSRS